MIIRNFLNAPLKPEPIHDGDGLCPHRSILGENDFETPLRFINYTVIPPNCSFGQHRHGDDNEVYIVLEGKGEYTENGCTESVSQGDIMVNARFASHGIRNTGDTDMRLLVLDVYNK